MRKTDTRFSSDVRVEAVTTTFVASGRPEGIHDLGRLLEMLNNPVIARHIELYAPAVRPLYRATSLLHLEAPLLVRRDDIIFANFDGPFYTRGTVRPPQTDVQVLLMAPPFQISGTVAVATGADATQALRSATQGFFIVRRASVYDADGAELGEGELIVVNGNAVQMTSPSAMHIEASMPATATTVRRTEAATFVAPVEEVAEEAAAARAA